MMNFKDYQELASRTAKTDNSFDEQLLEFALGCSGEAGEIADCVKKYHFHKHEFNKDAVVKEIGDVLWYLANLARVLNVDLEIIAGMNIEKLRKRFPNGFSIQDSIKRVDTNE